MKKRLGIFNLLLGVIVVAAAISTLLHHQDITDWYQLQTYKAPANIVQLADATTMIGRGRDLFYASQPVVEGRETFSSDCTNADEQTIILGCYRMQRIYLFDVTDPRLNGVEEVTAAHEMLHAVYERLGPAERTKINAMLDEQLKTVDDQRILDLIELYRQRDASQLYNEMHSILGTEYRPLTSGLEAHYKTYFGDRLKVVAYSEAYEGIFQDSKNKIVQFDQQLAELKQQIDANNNQLEASQAQLQNEADRMESLRSSEQFEAYNAAVPAYNTRVAAFNSLIAETKRLVAQYNNLVEQRNREAAAQNDLYHSLDSHYETEGAK